MTPYLIAGLLAVLYGLERWERWSLQQRHVRTVDQHAATMLEVTKWLAGIRPTSAPAQVTRVAEPEEAAEQRIEEAVQRGAKQILEMARVSGQRISPEEAEAEARKALAWANAQ